MAKTQRDARRSLGAVDPGDLAALKALDSETQQALLRRVHLTARGQIRADETESLACMIVGRLFRGDVEKAARAAVALAGRTVAQAYAGVDSLDAWAGEFGDMVEEIVQHGADRASAPHAWCPRPDARYATTDADVVAAALDSLHGTAHGQVLRDAAQAYLRHGSSGCEVCDDDSATGRRVSLTGILAHTRGLAGSDAQYHAIRRAMVAALKAVPVAALKAEHFYPHAEGGRSGSVFLDREPRLTGDTSITDAVIVTRADGTAYRTTHEHIVAAAPERSDDDKRADRIGEAVAAAPSRAVRRGNRKRSGGTGAYGSQVGARLSR